MGFTADLAVGVAVLLDAAAVAAWTPSAPYADDTVGIFLAGMPQHPAAVLVLSTYALADDPTYADSEVGLQVRTRSPGRDPRPGDDLADAAFAALQGLDHVVLSTGVVVVTCTRISALPMGEDQSGRWERADNYRLACHHPATHRL